MNGDACGLVDYGEIVVFIEHIERHFFGDDVGAFRFGDFDCDFFPGLDTMGGLGHYTIDADAAFGD